MSKHTPFCCEHRNAPVPRDHLVNHDSRDVDVGERSEAVFEHVFAKPRIPAAHHESVVVLADVLRNPILQPGVALGSKNNKNKGQVGQVLHVDMRYVVLSRNEQLYTGTRPVDLATTKVTISGVLELWSCRRDDVKLERGAAYVFCWILPTSTSYT